MDSNIFEFSCTYIQIHLRYALACSSIANLCTTELQIQMRWDSFEVSRWQEIIAMRRTFLGVNNSTSYAHHEYYFILLQFRYVTHATVHNILKFHASIRNCLHLIFLLLYWLFVPIFIISYYTVLLIIC